MSYMYGHVELWAKVLRLKPTNPLSGNYYLPDYKDLHFIYVSEMAFKRKN